MPILVPCFTSGVRAQIGRSFARLRSREISGAPQFLHRRLVEPLPVIHRMIDQLVVVGELEDDPYTVDFVPQGHYPPSALYAKKRVEEMRTGPVIDFQEEINWTCPRFPAAIELVSRPRRLQSRLRAIAGSLPPKVQQRQCGENACDCRRPSSRDFAFLSRHHGRLLQLIVADSTRVSVERWVFLRVSG